MLVNPMAAGRKSTLRSRESYKYNSIKEFDHCKNVSAGVEVDGFLGGKEEKEEGEIFVEHGEYAHDPGFQAVDGKETLPPPEKRRKISPIVWELGEKEGRISSKSRVRQVTAVSQFHPSLPSSPGAHGVLSGSSPNSSCVLPQEHSQDCNRYVDGKKDVQGWNITMSRWACDGLSPTGTDDKYKQVTGTSSPEVDESQRECPESTITRSSGSGSSGNCSLRLSTEDTDFDSIDDVEESDSPSSHRDGGSMYPQRNINMLQSCRSVHDFEMIKKINEGTYGVVYKAKDKKTGEIVALKKVKMNIERDGFPMSSLREINILLSFNHPFIVDVKEVVVDNYDGTFMVMEYMEHDLKGLMELKKQPFSMGEVKYMMLQLLEGVKYLHDNWILHRDLKTSNILLNNKGELKICDFGLSRQYGSPLKPYTPVVVTLWYRAPELLLGAKKYSTAIDMWSVGCIMAELVAKEPLFRGKTEIEQLHKVIIVEVHLYYFFFSHQLSGVIESYAS